MKSQRVQSMGAVCGRAGRVACEASVLEMSAGARLWAPVGLSVQPRLRERVEKPGGRSGERERRGRCGRVGVRESWQGCRGLGRWERQSLLRGRVCGASAAGVRVGARGRAARAGCGRAGAVRVSHVS